MFEIINEYYFINGMIAILIVSLVTGLLGSFMIWKNLSYLGDSISHASLLGVALSILLNISIFTGILCISVIFALLLSYSISRVHSIDTVLSIVTNVTMSLGMILLSFFPSANNNIIHSLFGDMLMLANKDLVIMAFVALIIIVLIVYRWKYWLIMSISNDLSASEGLNMGLIRLEFLVILSIFIAFAAQLVGVLLITAFLVIPAASARFISKTPLQMIVISTVISVLSGIIGLLLSEKFDIFPGPVVIMVSFIFLLCMYSVSKLVN
ncbi:metal ABC transporter permease [Ehrlichia ruminantium]|uniref:High-affinity zinc uptake system membrane protein ZnuB n=1 Tax=Ehrlichia ruminantium TaxID=779 RepID=A0AAE6UIK1_EHRRU|nr:metal ABC transporter permease [Ehrlichia ruminantium]QGR02572.1 metal ABC transporter permease [Ehrlichia ruminantium]QGR03492.1 metal ABC transporter permease [Ehrlichia ruminantium]QGR04417.1 metal ABC transporter permease [Ehrlichia ruminantium]